MSLYNKFEQYKKNYDAITDLYSTTESINKACKQLNINRNHYYYICKKYNFSNVCNDKKIKNQKGGKMFNNFNNLKNIKVHLISKKDRSKNVNITN